MSFVYISYVRQDREFAKRLAADLRSAGVAVWRDVEQIHPGEEWVTMVTNAIREADAVIVILSRYSTRSDAIRSEWHFSTDLGKRIIPIAIEPVDAYWGPLITQFQGVPAIDDYETDLKKVLDVLPSSVRSEKPVEPIEPKSKGYVFISYAEEDSEFVAALRGFLKDHGYAYWDYQESDRDYHSPFSLELESAIRDAAATLSVLSPDWKRSEWAPKEFMFSQEVDTPVFLLMAREMGPTLVTMGVPHIDFTADSQQGFEKLDRALRRKGLI